MPPNLFFVENLGQWEGAFAFRYAQGPATYFLTESGMTIDLRETAPHRGLPPFNGGTEGRSALFSQTDPTPTLPIGWGGCRVVHGHVLRLSYRNANPSPQLIGEVNLASEIYFARMQAGEVS